MIVSETPYKGNRVQSRSYAKETGIYPYISVYMLETGLLIPLEVILKAPDKVIFVAIAKKIVGLISLLVVLLVGSITNRGLFHLIRIVIMAILFISLLGVFLFLHSDYMPRGAPTSDPEIIYIRPDELPLVDDECVCFPDDLEHQDYLGR